MLRIAEFNWGLLRRIPARLFRHAKSVITLGSRPRISSAAAKSPRLSRRTMPTPTGKAAAPLGRHPSRSCRPAPAAHVRISSDQPTQHESLASSLLGHVGRRRAAQSPTPDSPQILPHMHGKSTRRANGPRAQRVPAPETTGQRYGCAIVRLLPERSGAIEISAAS
jgi:hypothetical protein